MARKGKRKRLPKAQVAETTARPPKRKAESQEDEVQPTRKRRVVSTCRTRSGTVATDPGFASKTCTFCVELKLLSDFPAGNELPPSCLHDLDVCRVCIRRSLSIQIANRTVERVGCPHGDRAWDPRFVQTHATREDHATYDAILLNRLLEAMPEFRRCLRPGCSDGQIYVRQYGPSIVECTSCGFRTCFYHQTPWHEDVTCEEFDGVSEIDEETKARTAREEAKVVEIFNPQPCPNCGVRIWKYEGCDHMQCKCFDLES